MSSRLGMRAAQVFRQPATFNKNLTRFAQRRWQTADATAAPSESAFAKLWNSPVGPKTVHFWAPIFKWGLVLAGAADFARPASQLSLTQNAALTATGTIWTRWCFVIKPRNLFLASVNFLLACVGATQVTRVLMYQQSLKGDSMGEEIKDAAKEQVHEIENVIKDPKSVLAAAEGKK